MAGQGERFRIKGFERLKPFIFIDNKMLIEHALDSFIAIPNHQMIIVIRKAFWDSYKNELNLLKKKYNLLIVNLESLTSGAASSALATIEHIYNDNPLLIADADNFYTSGEVNKFIEFSLDQKVEGILATFTANEEKYSYVKVEKGFVVETKEKEILSNQAISGLYFFAKGSFFVKNAIEMIIYNDKTKNEFYMSNVFNYLIKNNLKVKNWQINNNNYISIGTPEDFFLYLDKLKKQKNLK